MPPSDVIEFEALPLTTGVRTAVDLARYLPGDMAVAALDQCLRPDRFGRVMTTRDEIADYLAGGRHLHRSHRVGRVLRLSDGRAESPPETHTRLLLHRAD